MGGYLGDVEPQFTTRLWNMMYLFAAAACLIRPYRPQRRFWWGLAVLLAVLGMIRLAELQHLVTRYGRGLAYTEGWYGVRRPLQVAAIFGVLLAGGITVRHVASQLRYKPAELIAALTTSALLGLVGIRALSFHYVDKLFGVKIFNIQLGAISEGVLLLCIVGAALWKGKTREAPA